ncbi:hypothetical protein, partial [Prevotella corporis]
GKIGNMNTTESMAKELISAFNLGDKEKTYQKAKELLDRFKGNQYLFTCTDHHYLMAKAFHYLSATITDLSTEDRISITMCIYYHVMENYLKNGDAIPSSPEYEDLLGGCQLGLVIMLRHGPFFINYVLATMCQIMPDYAQEHFFNQVLLFCNIIYRAEERHLHYFSDDLVNKEFQSITQGITKYSLTSHEFSTLKQKCNNVIKNNSGYIAASFPMSGDDVIW